MKGNQNIGSTGSYIKTSVWDRVLKYAQLISVIILIFTIGVTWGKSQDRMFDNAEQKASTISHSDPKNPGYKDIHMTLQENQAEFVTRREYILLLKGQDEIKDMIRAQK